MMNYGYSINEVRTLIYNRYRIMFSNFDLLNIFKLDLYFDFCFSLEYKNYIFLNGEKVKGVKMVVNNNVLDFAMNMILKSRNNGKYRYIFRDKSKPILHNFKGVELSELNNEVSVNNFYLKRKFSNYFYNNLDRILTDKGIKLESYDADKILKLAQEINHEYPTASKTK